VFSLGVRFNLEDVYSIHTVLRKTTDMNLLREQKFFLPSLMMYDLDNVP
jgi:hypothetical protein